VDAVNSPEKPAAHMEIGYHSALPCLLALESRQKEKAIGRDANARASKVL
jgi:hypothetical protein